MTKPIPDKAEVVLEYPEKFYAGTFERSARFDAHFDETGVSLLFDHPGDADTRKSVHLHVHHALFADILTALARTVPAISTDDTLHRETLTQAAKALHEALVIVKPQSDERSPADDATQLSPEEEVLLLHVME